MLTVTLTLEDKSRLRYFLSFPDIGFYVLTHAVLSNTRVSMIVMVVCLYLTKHVYSVANYVRYILNVELAWCSGSYSFALSLLAWEQKTVTVKMRMRKQTG